MSNTYNFKIVLLGEGCVGKTSLVLRYVEDKFNSKHLSTLQVNILIMYVYFTLSLFEHDCFNGFIMSLYGFSFIGFI